MAIAFEVQKPSNELVYKYTKGSEEYELLKKELEKQSDEIIEIPLIIGGKEIYTGNVDYCICPHDHKKILAKYHKATGKEVKLAVEAAKDARKKWNETPWQHRATVFMKAAELLSKEWRYKLNAATMLNQSKTPYQAEIDSACELIDFLRFNTYYMSQIYKDQPNATDSQLNRMEYRPLEGFVYAITPFNFTAIGGNLISAPALMGNTVIWKPSNSSILSNYYIMKLFEASGLPAGVINFVPGDSSNISQLILDDKDLSGIHFTGSTRVFNKIWKQVASNLENYTSYPRLVGETGGKDYIFAHNSADIKSLAIAIIQGAFEYQGQKCSAASRCYIPCSVWEELRAILHDKLNALRVGDINDFNNFMGAVINKGAYDKITGYIDRAKSSEDATIIYGGEYSDEVGYYIQPTIVLTTNPDFATMKDEIFGPVVTIYLYEDDELDAAIDHCENSSSYALTGAVFAKCRYAIYELEEKLRYSAGNFYINDKPTGAVVGQQPFGGARKSGTNDKAGGKLNLLRWVTPRTIKENFNPPTSITYGHMEDII